MRYLGSLLFILFFPFLCFAAKEQDVKVGNELYQKGKYAAAADKYTEALTKAPDSDIINFNLGAASYKKEDYPSAVNYFQKSLLSDDKALQTKAHYNLGNTLYKWGIGQEDSQLSFAMGTLEQALGHYEKTLAADLKDEDARANYEFVKKELERLKTKQQEQQKQQTKNEQEKQGQAQEQPQPAQESQAQQSQEKHQQAQQQQAPFQQGQAKDNEPSVQIPEQFGQKESQGEVAQENKEDKNKGQTTDQASVTKAGELTAQEARMLLENYQQTEEPKGLLNLIIPQRHQREVQRDW